MLLQAPACHHDGDGGFGDEVIGEGAEEDTVNGESQPCVLGLIRRGGTHVYGVGQKEAGLEGTFEGCG